MERPLTPTSYLVLGLVRALQPCTSYDMKRLVSVSIGNFWAFPHSQLYAEPARLAADGLLAEEQEEGGRRRRLYHLTEVGEEALDDWLAEPVDDVGEIRDLGLLKLFFSGGHPDTVVALARSKAEAHRRERDRLLALRARVEADADPAQLATLELGVRWSETFNQFWTEIEAHPPT